METETLEQRLERLEKELANTHQLVGDRLDTVESALSETDRDLQATKPAVRYNYMMLGSVLLLLAAVAVNFLPEKVQEQVSGERVQKNLQGFGAIATDLFQIITVVGAGSLAYKARQDNSSSDDSEK